MDWFSWLSRSNLDPSVTYEYALAFATNELDREDIPYLDHEFLQSMGISIAKHRLEILKLATTTHKNKNRVSIRPVVWLKLAVKQTKTYLNEKIGTFFHNRRQPQNTLPLSLVPNNRINSMRWKVAMLQRNRRLLMKPNNWPIVLTDYNGNNYDDDGDNKKSMMMLTNGSPNRSSGSTGSSGWPESEANGDESGNRWNSSFSGDGENWSSSMEDVKWDTLFKNLKPT
ncbi:Sterile alpha motif (SAM) domain-containing protein [Striga hermonthica]|uniref:Sterile alpha motif (SAM) domain-containing protein n=1 Tax=Striga hermonthica TaxID=68872 RepID=A0A9N7N8L8_STRHE|nr:Sterile alpha motif (SAM) domain-containing protein [Striga hermonthica]